MSGTARAGLPAATRSEPLSGRRSGLALGALGLGAFVVGTSELVLVGILDPIATDTGVSIETAGTLVTAYALGIALGGPVLTALTGRVDRRLMLWCTLLVYVAANLLIAVVASFGLLFVSRMVAGSVHGAFIGVASMIAAGLVESGREGRAISIVFGGVALSTVVGVPLGTLIGQTFGWRATFGSVAILTALALVLTIALVPTVARKGGGRLTDGARQAMAPPVLATLGIGFLIIGGQFTALTYIEPFLNQVTGVSGGAISAFLLAYGAATAAGTFAGGRLVDRSATATLIVTNAALVGVLGGLYLIGPSPVLVAVVLVVWGHVGFGLVSIAIQVRVISLAGQGKDLAASLGASAANAGIATGALIGGQVVSHVGVHYTALAGAAVCLLALPVVLATRSMRPASA
ncbi:MFS transporter [Nonomuraea sp. 3N208]|uniref:MFS transporter n=1 Tax=Nonomuraea sp. 3N208 TaxID=3457421 RepID=UPI003FD259F6